ncbi:MAG: alpha-galactosidase [Lachnospiraceae bacterium]|nr:alpha-galactosidase [Lachnospiraceae bacterium]MBQ9606736.1 alpha-galactosidase [Lachnospiraceae bacterium]
MAVSFDDERRVFFISTQNTSYQIRINEYGMLLHSYYGALVGKADMSYLIKEVDRGFSGNLYESADRRGLSPDTLPLEYGTYGSGDYRVSAIKTVLENGSRTLDLRYASHRIGHGRQAIRNLPYVRDDGRTDVLEIELEDRISGIRVILIYNVFEDKDIITRSARIINGSENCVSLLKAASMSMDIQNRHMDLIHFHGRHAMERITERSALGHGVYTVGSKRGQSSHHNNPFVILCDRHADEDFGDCFGFMLMYSGNHAEEIELDQTGSVRVVSGISSEGFEWKLGAGESFDTPEVIMAYSGEGFNGLSHLYHRIIRENVCPARFRDKKRPVLINNWEGTYFDFTEKDILEIADAAADAGCGMLVLDDGWFGIRNNDKSGLGDWFVNKDKLPGGLKAIADHTGKLGMSFGLWIEPEMISEDSMLYREHPEWVLKDPDRDPVVARDQLVLNMSDHEVIDYLYDCISGILDSAEISYIKWDFNRSLANVYSSVTRADMQGEVSHRFVLGTYELLERIGAAYPDVMIEGCAGGGGRFDAGMLFYCPQIWCSDNTDAINRLIIQKGTSYGYPVCTMGSHVSISPNHQTGRETPLVTRAIVAMSGTFGYELDPRKLDDNEKNEIRQQIAIYERYCDLICNGRYYRLTGDEDEKCYTAWEIVAGDRSEALISIVVTDMKGNQELPFLKLKGLDPEASYVIDGVMSSAYELPGAAKDETEHADRVYMGKALMHGGLTLDPLYGQYPAMQLHLKNTVAKNDVMD